MSDELQPDEQRLSGLFRQVEAPDSMRRWGVPGATGRRSPWWARPLRALFVAGGERRLRPLAAALVLPVLVLAVGGGMQLRAHFSGESASGGANPPARMDAAMAFDAARGQVVMFGGRAADGQPLGDTWTWDGSSWTRQHPAESPGARAQASMAFDAAHGVVVLYGGLGEGGPSQDSAHQTWTWDGSNWHQMITAHSPSAPYGDLAYDGRRNQVVLVDQAPFTTHVVTGVPVPPRTPVPAHAPGVALPTPQAVIAPMPATAPVQFVQRVETWTWTGSDWRLMAPRTTLSGRPDSASLAWDDTIQRLTLLTGDAEGPMCGGGQTNTVSGQAQPSLGGATSSSPGRSLPTPVPSPPPPPAPPSPLPLPTGVHIVPGEVCTAMAERSVWSASSGLHCAGCPLAHQWTWDGSNWNETKLGGTVSFAGVETVVNDPSSGRPLAMDSEHTWTWNGSTWVRHDDPAGLTRRSAQAMAADTAHHVVVLFGGRAPGGVAADTWTWDGKAWTHAAGGLPPASSSIGLPESRGPSTLPAQPVCGVPHLSVSDNHDGMLGITVIRFSGCEASPAAMVTLVDAAGRPLAVTGNGFTVAGQTVTLRWSNWCGARAGSVRVQVANATTTATLGAFPTCTDRSRPSLLVLDPAVRSVTIP